jgi:hypothetical protein
MTGIPDAVWFAALVLFAVIGLAVLDRGRV